MMHEGCPYQVRGTGAVVPDLDVKNQFGGLTRTSGRELREEVEQKRCVRRDRRSEEPTDEYTGSLVIACYVARPRMSHS